MAAADHSQPVFSHSDRTFTGWKTTVDAASFYCLYRDLADSYFVFWSCILRQIMSCRSFYRVFKQSHTIKARTYTEIAPLRYGMLAGFVILPFFDSLLACAYCNFFLFDLFVNYFVFGYFISLSSSMILTLFLWAGLFGIFTKGGRGFCNFLCPVGAVQNLLYSFSSRLPFVYRLIIDRQKCIGCKSCSLACPMEAMVIEERKAVNCVHNCILCGVCISKCPEKAIRYGRKNDEE